MPDGESVVERAKERLARAEGVHGYEELCEELRGLLAAVEAAKELDRAFEHAEEPEMIENELLLRWGGMSNALTTLYDTPAAATAASSEESDE